MVERHIEHFEAELAEREREHGGAANSLVEAYLDLVVADFARKQPPSSGVLAAIAENPDFIAPLKEFNRTLLDRLKANASDENAALVVFLALEGLRSMKLFDADVLTRQEIRRANRETDDIPALRLEPLRLLGDRQDGTGLGTAHPFREAQHHFT